MKILLLSPPLVHPRLDNDTMKIAPPLAIYHLGGMLKDKGCSVTIYDSCYMKSYYRNHWDETSVGKLISGVDIIGISSNSFNWGMAKEFIEIVKSRPNSPLVICGGVHPSFFFEHVMSVSDVDVVVREDGEVALMELVEAMARGTTFEAIPNIVYRENGKLKINPILPVKTIPSHTPDYTSVPDRYYYSLPVELSRGCPFECTFCGILFIRSWRGLDVKTSMERMERSSIFLPDKSVANSILFTDECFTINTQRAREIFTAMSRDKLNYKIHFTSRIGDLLSDDELIRAIPRQKVSTLQVGIECGYDEGLVKVKKGITLEDVENCLKILHREGIAKFGLFSFIIGFPWEKYGDCVKTIEYAQRIEEQYGVISIVNWWMPLKSKLWDQQEELGFYLDSSVYDDPLWPQNEEILRVVHPHIPTAEINKLMSTYKGYITHLMDMV